MILARPPRQRVHASVLIIVLWVVFGLVALTLYFAESMSFRARAADHQVASIESYQAIDGAIRYVTNVLATYGTNGTMPDMTFLLGDSVNVGDAAFWLVGRDTNLWQRTQTRPTFGLVDEASKLNLNTATREMLEMLPRMTPEFAAAIIDWRDSDSDTTDSGAEDDFYQRQNPPYHCKNAPFETVEELRLLNGATLQILLGEDTNLNGILDPNEDDGETSFPTDNQDGRLDPGILEFVTVSSSEPNTRADGSARVNVSDPSQQEVAAYLTEKLGSARSNQVLQRLGVTTGGGPGGGQGGQGNPGGGTGGGTAVRVTSGLEFCIRGGLTTDEMNQVEGDLTVTNATVLTGLINVNTASVEVLTCVPGIGTDFAQTLVSSRESTTGSTNSIAWIVEVLGNDNAIAAGPYLTARSYQFTADIAAVGHHNRGYQRVRYLVDVSDATPHIRARRDLSHLGWALGRDLRERLLRLADTKP